jgi:hypothetical protein
MFFRSKRREKRGADVLRQAPALAARAPDRVSRQREAWRRAAASVIRAWNEWTAADSSKRSELYRRYTCALDEEEQAAARLERALSDSVLS